MSTRSVRLGGGAVQHLAAEKCAAAQALAFANMAVQFADAGDCRRAVRMLTAAWDERGRAQANAAFTDKVPKGEKRRKAWGQAGTQTAAALRAAERAEAVVVSRCVLK